MDAFFIVNPHSSSGRTGRHWPETARALQRRLGRVRFGMTRGTMHAAELARGALGRGFDRIIAVGGDGTLNEVLNGFFRDGLPVRREAAVGYLPSGTGADFARTLELHDLSLEERITRLLNGSVRRLDCGQVSFQTPMAGSTVRLFINESSIGFSANTADAVNRASKRFGGRLAFLIGVLRCLIGLRNPRLRILVDGREVFDAPALLVAVANGRYFGGGMMIAPPAVADDGLFDIVVVAAMSRTTVLRKIGSIYRGEHLAEPEVQVFRGREVRITALGERVLLEMDGEQPGTLAAEFHISHRTVPFLC